MPSTSNQCAYISGSLKEKFDSVRSGDGAEADAKALATTLLKRSGCDISGEEPPLKCRKVLNLYVVEVGALQIV